MENDELTNWIGDPVGSAATWTVRNVVPLFRRSPTVEVPDVVGQFLVAARTMIQQKALRVRVVGPNEMGSNNVVLSQRPGPGTIVRRRDVVTLHVTALGQEATAAASP